MKNGEAAKSQVDMPPRSEQEVESQNTHIPSVNEYGGNPITGFVYRNRCYKIPH